MIDWSDLHPLKGDQRYAFEELAFQIAKALYGHQGQFVRVDDSGGGDGVEFYMRLPNGDEWGWQTKFFPDGRLSSSSRYGQIRSSLDKACKVHPRLTKWILCAPLNLTPAERRWFDGNPLPSEHAEPLPRRIPEGRQVALEYWGGSEFTAWLAEPRFVGKKHFFFGELELSLDWFSAQFEKQTAALKDKFNPSLHVETQVDDAVHNLLGDEEFIRRVEVELSQIEEQFLHYDQAVRDLEQEQVPVLGWDMAKGELVGSAMRLGGGLRSVQAVATQCFERLSAMEFRVLRGLDEAAALDALDEAYEAYETLRTTYNPNDLEYRVEDAQHERVALRASTLIAKPADLAGDLRNALTAVLQEFHFLKASALHIFGLAGTGKTHLACQSCEQRRGRGLPALFVPGRAFTSDQPLNVQLRHILDIPPSYSWNNFVHALAAAAEAYKTRIPVVIDGLNEAVHRGALSQVWEIGLSSLVTEMSSVGGLALITTCRTSYLEAIWPEGEPENHLFISGFDNDDVREAVSKYFEWYRIRADVTLAPLSQFRFPIYLKLFCETKNADRDQNVEVYVGEETLFEVFDEYLDRCNQVVSQRLNRHPAAGVVPQALSRLAGYLWENPSRHVPLNEAYVTVDGKLLADLDLQQSVTTALLNEGLLVEREWYGPEEGIAFTYDLLGGYVIARKLLEEQGNRPKPFQENSETVTKLFGNNYQTLHPLYEDIGRCLAALLPRASGQYLHELSTLERAGRFSVAALFEIDPEVVNSRAVEYIAALFDDESERAWLLRLGMSSASLIHVGHPLNADFWSGLLKTLSVSDRDLSWSEHVRHHLDWYEDLVAEFQKACLLDSHSELGEQRVHLLAPIIRWCLTSTIRPFRDRATHALYDYGCRWPQRLLELVEDSLSVNDPYVPERMLAALYGVSMARQWDFVDPSFRGKVLPTCARMLFDAMFQVDARWSTTHILARDYAKHTIDIALMHDPQVLTDDERHRITPPFEDGGIRDWGRAKNKNEDEYQFGNHPIDFLDDNPLERLGFGIRYQASGDSYRHGEEHLWWRIYDLGYSLERFGAVDSKLAVLDRTLGGNRFQKKVDHYGRKYCRIATLELAGLRDDLGLLNRGWVEPGGRLAFADIDPSFPDEIGERCLVQEDFLGDPNTSLQEWVLNGGTLDIRPYLNIEEIDGHPGPWVLLNGFITQEDTDARRATFMNIRGFIVRNGDAETLYEHGAKQDFTGHCMPRVPWDTYRFAGEVPWCETYPLNGWDGLELVLATRIVRGTERTFFLVPDGIEEPLEMDRVDEILAEGRSARDTTEIVMEETGRQVVEREVPFEREKHDYQTIEVMIPVREDHWESYHSETNPGRLHATPARELADFLDLCGQPHTFDLFEKDGRRASITIRCGNSFPTEHDLIYLRKDLLDRFLREYNYNLLWAIWGERQADIETDTDSEDQENPGLEESYRAFQTIERYSDKRHPIR